MAERSVLIRVGVRDADRAVAELRKVGVRGSKQIDRIDAASKRASRGLRTLDGFMGEASDAARGFAGRLGPVGGALAGLGPAGLGAAAGVGALTVGLTAGLRRAREAVDQFDQLAKTADNLGVTTSALQEYRYVADRTGVSQAKLDDGIAAFTKRLGELRAETGSLNTLLNKTDEGFKQQLLGARSTDEALTLLIERLADSETAFEKNALAAAAFGRGPGLEFAKVARDGADAVQRLRQEARDLGVVIEDDVLRQAERTSDQLATMQRIADAELNRAFVELSPVLIKSAGLFADIAGNIRSTVDAVNELTGGINEVSTAGLRDRLEQVQENIRRQSEIYREAVQAENDPTFLDRITNALPGATSETWLANLRDLRAEEDELKRLINSRTAAQQQSNQTTEETIETKTEETDATQKVVKALEFELEQMARNDRERTIANELRKLGADATDEERRRVRELTGALYDQEQAIKAITAAEREAAQERAKLQREADELLARQRDAGLSDPERAYKERVSEADRLFSRGAIGEEARDRERANAEAALYEALETGGETARRGENAADETTERLQRLKDVGKAATDSLAEGLFDIASGASSAKEGLAAIEDRLLAIANQLATDALSGFFSNQLGGLFGGGGSGGAGGGSGGGGFFASLFAGLFHQGGRGDAPPERRVVPASTFDGAPRLHSGTQPGLRAGEVAAIIRRDERVLNPAQTRAFDRAASAPERGSRQGDAATPVVLNVHGVRDVDEFRRSQSQVAAQARGAFQRARRNL